MLFASTFRGELCCFASFSYGLFFCRLPAPHWPRSSPVRFRAPCRMRVLFRSPRPRLRSPQMDAGLVRAAMTDATGAFGFTGLELPFAAADSQPPFRARPAARRRLDLVEIHGLQLHGYGG